MNSFLLSSQSFEIKPFGKLQLRYEDRLMEYSPLGQALLNTNKTKYDDYIIGGTLGTRILYDQISFNTLLYGVGRLHEKDTNPYKN